ncbi:Ca(2+)-dependent cysteine protease [Mortierella alpina]|nr:Ca(2+)-dependent cysteine protease [Mortierella alpina]
MYSIPQHLITPQEVPPPPEGWAVRESPKRDPPRDFQLSTCQGRKRALFIGINYFGQQNELRGCINDVKNIRTFITQNFGFREEDTISLTDDQEDPTRIPTHANILAAMKWLVRDAQPNDSFFFHYSGHGGQTEDRDGDEDDGYDETIYPVDHEEAGFIIDDTMHEILVDPLPAGCRLTAIMDCCHSGSALDLPYIYSTTGNLKEPNMLADVGTGVLSAGMAYMQGDMGGMLRGLGSLGKKLMAPKNRDKALETKSSPADCIMLSGCKDTQTSADAHEQGFGMTGAMTFSFITALTANPQQSYLQLLNSIRDVLRSKYEQKPQLSSSHPCDLNLLFTMKKTAEMSRMTIRTREAPMDWEREHDRNLPNIFSAPQPLESEPTTKSHDAGQSGAFGSTSSDSNRQLHKDSSFSSQLSQSSLTSEGWGSTSLRPFRQDSQLSSTSSGQTTPRQGSFSLARHDSFPHSSEAPTETFGPALGGMGGSTIPRLSQQRSQEGRLFPPSDVTDKKNNSFDLGTLRNEVCDREQEQERQRSTSRSPLGRHLGSSTSTRARIRSNLQYRSNTEPNGFWSGDEEDEEDDTAGHHLDEDSDEYDHRSRTLSRNKSWSPENDSRMARTFQGQDFSTRTRRFQPQSHRRQKPHGRVWSENVDLPFILSGYVQVAMNAAFAMAMVYIAASFIIGIQSEVSMNANVVLEEENKRQEICRHRWESFDCNNLVNPVGDKLTWCAEARKCMDSTPNLPGRASVAAKTFGLIVDSFVHAISFKTMAFVIVVLFGGLYVSNNTLSSYRNSYIMHHQNDTSPPAPSSPAPRTNVDSSKREDATVNHTSLPASRERYRINGREASFSSGSSQFQGGNASHSRALIPQPPGSLQRIHHSDSDQDMDM